MRKKNHRNYKKYTNRQLNEATKWKLKNNNQDLKQNSFDRRLLA